MKKLKLYLEIQKCKKKYEDFLSLSEQERKKLKFHIEDLMEKLKKMEESESMPIWE